MLHQYSGAAHHDSGTQSQHAVDAFHASKKALQHAGAVVDRDMPHSFRTGRCTRTIASNTAFPTMPASAGSCSQSSCGGVAGPEHHYRLGPAPARLAAGCSSGQRGHCFGGGPCPDGRRGEGCLCHRIDGAACFCHPSPPERLLLHGSRGQKVTVPWHGPCCSGCSAKRPASTAAFKAGKVVHYCKGCSRMQPSSTHSHKH